MTALAPEVLDLLTAIRDALDVPLPTGGEEAERAFTDLLERRRTAVHGSVAALVAAHGPDLHAVTWDAEFIRRRTADLPVTYTVYPGGAL